MSAKFTDLHCKEVICVGSGQRLGFIQDVIIQLPKGEISAIVIPGPCKLCGLGPPRDDYVIPWDKIEKIGEDVILVCGIELPLPDRGGRGRRKGKM